MIHRESTDFLDMYVCTHVYIYIYIFLPFFRQLLEMFPEDLLQFCPKVVPVVLRVLSSALEHGTVSIKQVFFTVSLLIFHVTE